MLLLFLIWAFIIWAGTYCYFASVRNRSCMTFGQEVAKVFDKAWGLAEKSEDYSPLVLRTALVLAVGSSDKTNERLYVDYKERLKKDFLNRGCLDDFRRVHAEMGFSARVAYELLDGGLEMFWLALPQKRDQEYDTVNRCCCEAPYVIKSKVLKRIDWLANEFENGRNPMR